MPIGIIKKQGGASLDIQKETDKEKADLATKTFSV